MSYGSAVLLLRAAFSSPFHSPIFHLHSTLFRFSPYKRLHLEHLIDMRMSLPTDENSFLCVCVCVCVYLCVF